MFRLIRSDIVAKARWCYEDDSWRGLLKACATDGTPAMFWYRVMQWARRHHLLPLELIANKLIVWGCGCVIGRGAEFGPGFVLVHSIGVVINGRVSGGTNVRLGPHVTLGAKRGESPTIGNDVYIGAGARVLASVGSNCRVGANAVVISPIPDGATAVGVPARIAKISDHPYVE